MEPILLYVVVALLGAMAGSYLKAWMWRVRKGLWKFGDRSMCETCRKQLSWYDNIPVVSFVLLRGRCRFCRKPIARDTLITELLTAFLFAVVTLHHEPLPTFNIWMYVRDIFFVMLLVVVFVYDWLYMEILSGVVWIGTLVAIGFNVFMLGLPWRGVMIGVLVGGGFFLVQYLVSRGKWIGGGDVRLGVMMGALLGWPVILLALLVSYVSGTLVALPMLLRNRKALQSELPFGTFLTAGTFISLLWGEQILRWYLALIRW